jgi:hypothetical protein
MGGFVTSSQALANLDDVLLVPLVCEVIRLEILIRRARLLFARQGTHIATCASQDWRQVDNLVMGGFVTSSQAQRKWYSKVITSF